MVQEFRVREMLEARGIISHDVFYPVDEGDLGAIAMVALVKARHLVEVSGWTAGGSVAFGLVW